MELRNSNGQFSQGSQHLVRHGKSQTRIYGIWSSMLARCNNPNTEAYPDYGGRGIRVCEAWHDFANFYADMGEKPLGLSLDRIDNNKGYEPGNVRWADRRTQCRNRRNVTLFTVDGVEKTLDEMGVEIGLKPGAVWARINKGWDPFVAATTPYVPQKDRNLAGTQKPRPPKTHCVNGHEMTPENTYIGKSRPNSKNCVTCKNENWARWNSKNKRTKQLSSRQVVGTS